MKDGYYWVNWYTGWTIGKYRSSFGTWEMPGQEQWSTSNEFTEIGDYIETPEKYKE